MFNRFANFMMGRNGMDALNLGMLLGAVVLSAAGVFVRGEAAYNVLRILSTLLIVVAVWRMFSRKLEARRRENERFLAVAAGARTKLANLFGGVRGDRHGGVRSVRGYGVRGDGTHRYYTCPSCRNRLRVPAGKGKIEITCPKCGTRFAGKS